MALNRLRLVPAAPISSLKVIRGGRRKKPYNYWRCLLLLLFLIAMTISGRRGFKEVVKYGPDGTIELTTERKSEITRAKKKLERAEVYLLISRSDQFIDCFLCPAGKVMLKTGETAKVGTTVNPGQRYNRAYFRQHDVRYQVYFRGPIDEVLKKEIELLGSYPLWPENIARKEPLLYPPLNSKLK